MKQEETDIPKLDRRFVNAQGKRIYELEEEVLDLKYKVDMLTIQQKLSNELIKSYQEIVDDYKEMLNIDESE